MSLQIQQRETEGIVILDLVGDLVFGPEDAELRDKLLALRTAGQVNIIFNLKEVHRIDSTGLGTLVFALARLRKAGGNLALANLNRSHLQLLQLTRLGLAFERRFTGLEGIRAFLDGAAETRQAPWPA